MTLPNLAFAVPGDITTVTGGFIYDRRLIGALTGLGHGVRHIELPAVFPNPTDGDIAKTMNLLATVPADSPLIVDGLAYGALPKDALGQLRAPLVALVHHPLAKESGLTPAQRDHLFQAERDNLAFARHILVPSPHTASILASEYGVAPDKLTVVRPGTDRTTAQTQKPNPPLILSVGIQAPRKGHDVLLRALARIADLEWNAVIVGSQYDPVHAKELRVLQTELELSRRVTFTGQVLGERLNDLYEQASLFALATRYEGYGIVLDEAQAHGLPIVSCATGAVPDTVPPDSGILVPPDAPDLFAQALKSLLLDTDKRNTLARGARRAGQKLPDWNDAARTASNAIISSLRKDDGRGR